MVHNGKRVALDLEDKLLCGVGKEKLYRAQRDWTFAWLWKACIPVTACSTRTKCAAAKKHLQQNFADVFPVVRALEPWSRRWEKQLCERCATVAKARHERGRATVWRDLPLVFDFTTWADLELVEDDKVCDCMR